MAEVTIDARPNGPYVVTGTIELHDTTGMFSRPKPGPCSAVAVRRQKSRSVTGLIRRSAFKPQHKQCLIQPTRVKQPCSSKPTFPSFPARRAPHKDGNEVSRCWRRRRSPAKPADCYFLIRSRPRLLQCPHNSRYTAPKRLPMVCRKYDDRKAPRTDIHLKPKIPVGRNHRLETAAFGRIDQIAVRQRRPPHLRSRPYIMASQQVSQRARHILIEQNPHYGVGLCRS